MLSDEQIRAMAEEMLSMIIQAERTGEGLVYTQILAVIRRHLHAAGGDERVVGSAGLCNAPLSRPSPDDRLARAVGLLQRARQFIAYAWYELDDGPLEVGTQFPTKGCADKVNIAINAFLASLPAPPDEQTKGDRT